jgi:hypothetical protein
MAASIAGLAILFNLPDEGKIVNKISSFAIHPPEVDLNQRNVSANSN